MKINLVEFVSEDMSVVEGFSAEEVGDVDGGVCFCCIVVCEETLVGEGPSEEVVDEEDGSVGVGVWGGSDVAWKVGKCSNSAFGSSIPFESFEAAVGG